jgi:hypothetical protein
MFTFRNSPKLPVAIGLKPKTNYITRELEFYYKVPYEIIEYINEYLPKSAVIFSFSSIGNYYIDRIFIECESFQAHQLFKANGYKKLLKKLKEIGITHILTFKDSFKESTCMILHNNFIRKYLKLLYSIDNASLYEVCNDIEQSGKNIKT